MIVIPREEPILTRAELVERVERGGVVGRPVESWVDLSPPSAVTLTKDMDLNDPELANFLSGEAGKFRYDYVRLSCSFYSKSPERFEKAWMSVKLTPAGPAQGPVAWSIYPSDTYDTLEESSSTKIGAKLKILSAEIGDSVKLSRKIYSVRGFKEGSPSPFWEMTTNQVNSLEGLLRFHLVVRSPAGCVCNGEVRVEAIISDRTFVVFRSKRPFDQSPSLEFELPPK